MITRPKYTFLAATATFSSLERRPRIVFHDAAGKRRADLPMHDGWKREGSRLLRHGERHSGAGDDIRTLEVVETLEVDAGGDPVYRRATSEIEPRRGKPETADARYTPAAAP